MERYVPEVRRLRERTMVVRDRPIGRDLKAAEFMRHVEIPSEGCGGEVEAVDGLFIVNGALRPGIEIALNERQFWRIVNASADRYLDLQVDGRPFDHCAGWDATCRAQEPHTYVENTVPLAQPAWLDTVSVPVGGSVDVILDFNDPDIRGLSVCHCHLLNHEDKGMMAKILLK